MQEGSSANPPPGSIQIDPDVGFGPHLTNDFLDLYGKHSVFVTAAVDELTWRFVGVLLKSGRLPVETVPPQYVPPEMRESLDALLQLLATRGMDKPWTVLMRSALGHEPASGFQAAAGDLLGSELIGRWLQALELQDYVGASALLEVH